MRRMLLKTRQRRRQLGLLDDEPRCSRCDGINKRWPHRYCHRCHAETMRRLRAAVSRETFRTTRQAS
jgi:hypothetical protein